MKFLLWLFILTAFFPNAVTAKDKLPNREERIFALSEIWKELHYGFAFPETLTKVNIDSLYMAYLPKIENAKDYYVYFRTLSSFMAHFNDAHTRIYASDRPDDIPPINLTNIGERIIVNNVAKNKSGLIPIGSEILSINNIPVLRYIRDSVYQYISASTVHWKFDKAVTEMLYGERDAKVALKLKTPTGTEKEVVLVRNYNSSKIKEEMVNAVTLSPIQMKIIDGDIGYIKLNSFSGAYIDTIKAVFNQEISQLRKCKGLIFDIRGNRGGTDEAWEDIASYLIPQSKFQVPVKCFSRKCVPIYKIWGEYDPRFKDFYNETSMEEIHYSPYINKIVDTLKLIKPLVVISGQYVGSAAEDFLMLIKKSTQAEIVGEPSVGCMGEPMFIKIPGNLTVMICAKKYITQDGTQPNETGILPDIQVKRDYNAYLKGEDNVLECALEVVKKRIMK